jgi:hypothetical protein
MDLAEPPAADVSRLRRRKDDVVGTMVAGSGRRSSAPGWTW